MRGNRRELPANLHAILKSKSLNDTLIAKSGSCILTSYKCTKSKSVTLLSTLHDGAEIEGEKKKPTTVLDYNSTKYGVDVVDQMARQYTCKVASRRWPVQVKLDVIRSHKK